MFASSPAGRLGQTKDERGKRNPPTNWNGNARNVQCQTTQWHREIQYAISNKYNTVTERNTMFNVKQIQHREIQCQTNTIRWQREIQYAMPNKCNMVSMRWRQTYSYKKYPRHNHCCLHIDKKQGQRIILTIINDKQYWSSYAQ